MIKKLFCITTLGLALAFSMSAVFAAEDTIQDKLKGFDEFMKTTMEKWHVPGAALAVVKDGKVVFSKAYGYRDLKNKKEVTPETLFAIGSTTKAFTATALGILVDEGKLDWDKPVRNYMPLFKMFDDYATMHVTAKDLLSHRTGVPGHDVIWYKNPITREEIIKKIQYMEPVKDFRTAFLYNNIMYVVAGYMITDITGESWEGYVKEKILTPLKMNDTDFSVIDMQKNSNYSLPYKYKNDQITEVPFVNLDTIGPAGSINSNVEDMSNWLIMNMSKGQFDGKQVISEKNLDEIFTPQMLVKEYSDLNPTKHISYMLGWGYTLYRSYDRICHDGEIDGFHSHISFLPKEKIGVVVLANNTGNFPTVVANNIYDRLLGLDEYPWSDKYKEKQDKAIADYKKTQADAKKQKRPASKPSHPLKDYTGRYTHPALGTITITLDAKNNLKGKFGFEDFAIKPYFYDIFEAYDPESDDLPKIKLNFDVNNDGVVEKVGIPVVPELNKNSIFVREKEDTNTDKK